MKHDLLPLLFNFAVEYYIRKVKKMKRGFGIEWGTSASDLNLFRKSVKTMVNSQLSMVMEGSSSADN
jgi:hypothetical protein